MLDPICVYKTPCGWCSKFDKKCDGKIGVFKPTKKWFTNEEINEICSLKRSVEKYSKE